ncbi:uncharacterized protein [Nicotiana tomentosiformis]|uniref:uncharacterized protein n=1 Tax=Nicotiana tomentosiformis TaxID=4098 RepID=UPI00388CC855
MSIRFTTLTNELKFLGRIIPEDDRVEKILTRESKNIATHPLDELIGNLKACELRRQTMKMDVPKKERSLALRITEVSNLEDGEMKMITKEFKKYLRSGKGYSRSGSYNKARAPEMQANNGCYKCGKTEHIIKNCPLWEIEWKNDRVERKNRKKEQDDERAIIAVGESDEEIKVQVKGSSQIWYMDSGCSKHMTRSKNQLFSLEDLK